MYSAMLNLKLLAHVFVLRSQNNKPFDLYDWLADTGTTSHITHRCDAFATYEMIPKVKVSGVGGVHSFAIGRSRMDLLAHSQYVLGLLYL